MQLSIDSAFARKVRDIVVIDLNKVPNLLYDYLLIGTCQSEVQLYTTLNNLRKIFKKMVSKKYGMNMEQIAVGEY